MVGGGTSIATEPAGAVASPWLVWGALAVIYVVWGSTYLAIRVMVDYVPPMIGTGVRFLLGLLVLVGWLAGRGELRAAMQVTRAQLAGAAAVGVLLLVGGTGLVGIAEQHIDSGLTALTISIVPLLVILLRKFDREQVPRGTTISVVTGLTGIGLLVIPAGGAHGSPWWVLVVVGAACFWSIGSYVSGRIAMPADYRCSAIVQMAGATLVCALLAAARGEYGQVDRETLSTASVVAMLYLALAGSVLAFTAYSWLLLNAPISKVATYAYVNPVVAVGLGWLILDERITLQMLAAAVVVIGSVAVTVSREARSGRRASTPEPAAP